MAEPLSYLPAPKLLQRRWPRRIFLAFALIAALVLLARYGRRGLAHLDLMYIQARCAGYSAPDEQVVFEEEPTRAAVLLRDRSYQAVPFLHAEHGAMAVRRLEIWPRYLGARGVPSPDMYRQCAPLFLHRLQAPGGSKRIVYVGYDYYHLQAARCAVLSAIKTPGNGSRIVSIRADVFETFFPTHVLPRDLRFYAGQIDRDDPSHFTIGFEWAGERGRIHGWLQDDETVRFEVRVQRRPSLSP